MAKFMNSEQQAPAQTSLAGFSVGDHVRLPNLDCTLIVIGFQPPSVLVLRAPSGRELRAGWAAVSRIRTRSEIEGRRHE